MIPANRKQKFISIRSRLLMSYSVAFLVAFCIGIFIIFTVVRITINDTIERELQNSTQSILNMVQTAVNASIKNHLRAVAEKNKEIVTAVYGQFTQGDISEERAKKRASNILLSQPIGKSGYIYCINSNGIIQVHPKEQLVNSDLSDHSFIREQISKRDGYIEYNWANPGEIEKRPKALYMTYFAPWDWIISASSYRDEFNKLISVSDFQDNILSISFGKTGYPFIMNSDGDLIIHPKLQGTNILNSTDSNGRMFIKEICDRKNGKIIYPWKNPGEEEAREKLVIFNYIPEMDWIVASSGYLDEFYATLSTIGYTALSTVGVMLLLIIPISWRISKTIARPLQELILGFEHGANANYTYRMGTSWGSELDRVARYYNIFMEKLETTSHQLVESEEKFRSIFENSVEGIFQSTPAGRFITANPAMADMLGYRSPDELISSITDIGAQMYVDPDQRKTMFEMMEKYSVLNEYQIQLYKKNRKTVWCSLNATAYKNDNGEIEYSEGFLTDITQRKHYEETLKRTNQELETRVHERTSELSNWVSELEIRNAQSNNLREMNELIQVCRDHTETYAVIARYLNKFFPDDSGQLFIVNKEAHHLESVLSWGNTGPSIKAFPNDECWALRQGKPYMFTASEKDLACRHFPAPMTSGSMCVPMMTQGEILGLLCIYPETKPNLLTDPQFHQLLAQKQDLAVSIVEQLGLALTNLNLRSSLQRQSLLDPLTGLYNRRFLETCLHRESYNIHRYQYSIGIIMIDVDKFKKFNDDFGHECGDTVLKELGKALKNNARGGDFVCRYGGEEFIMILINANVQVAVNKAEALCRMVREELTAVHNGKIHRVTISLGVAMCPDHAEAIDKAMGLADAALYRAKSEGRDRVSVHQPPATPPEA